MNQRIEGWVRRVSITLVVATFGTWAFALGRFDADLPRLDQWDTPSYQMMAWRDGRLDLGLLANPHNESRKVLPNLISIGLYAASGHYDVQAELGVGWALVLLIALGVGWIAWATTRRVTDALLVAAVFSALSWSAHTMSFHLFSITFERLLPDVFLVASIALFVSRGVTGWTTAGACAAGALTQFSFAGGIAFWPIAGAYLLMARGRTWTSVGPHFATLCVAAATSSWVYFGWSTPVPIPVSEIKAATFSPSMLPPFLLFFLGNAVTSSHLVWACFLGALVLAAFAGLVWRGLSASARLDPRAPSRECVAAWACLGAFAIAQGALAGLARASVGLWLAGRPDYTSHPILLWVSVVALGLALSPARRRPVALAAALALAVAMTATLVRPYFWRHLFIEQQRQAWSAACHLLVRHVVDPVCLDYVFPPLDRRLATIEDRQSVLAHPALDAGPLEPASETRGRIDSVDWSAGRLRASGRVDAGSGRTDGIAFALQDGQGLRFVGLAPVGIGDLALRQRDRRLWQVDVELAESSDPAALPRFFVVDAHARTLHPLRSGD